MSKIYLGPKCESLDYSQLTPITRVNLVLDNDTMYTAGDDTGRTLEVECLWATQAMCNSILAQVGNKSYTAFTASQALLDPAAELGDSVTVGGVYGIIGNMNTTLDALCPSEISAPGGDEIDDEYPYKSASDRQTQRELAKIRSNITKTAEEIALRVEQVEGDYTELKVTLDGVTISGPDGSTKIKGSSIDTTSISANAISASQVNLTGAITFGDLASNVQDSINSAQSAADDAAEAVSAWTYGGTAYIDGTMIMIDTVTASKLRGGAVQILTNLAQTAGQMTVTGADTSTYAIELHSNGSLRLSAGAGAAYIESGYGTWVQAANGSIAFGNGSIRPNQSAVYSCGMYNYLWSEVYAATSTIVTSDAAQKHDIAYDLSRYDSLFDAIKPATYEFNSGRSGRTHTGMISQDIEAALIECGLDSTDFAGFVKSPRIGEDGQLTGEYDYALRYEEFIALCIDQIQRLKARVKALEEAA